MASQIYPLPMRFPATRPPIAGDHIDVTITPEGWSFITTADRERFEALPAGERLELRRAFAGQVELAQNTPTKGDNMKGTTIYRVRFQRPADSSQDSLGTTVLEGENFPDLVQEAARMGYPRVISGEERTVTPWTPVEGFEWDEAS